MAVATPVIARRVAASSRFRGQFKQFKQFAVCCHLSLPAEANTASMYSRSREGCSITTQSGPKSCLNMAADRRIFSTSSKKSTPRQDCFSVSITTQNGFVISLPFTRCIKLHLHFFLSVFTFQASFNKASFMWTDKSECICFAKWKAKFTGTALPTILYPSVMLTYLNSKSSGKV